MLHSLVWFPPPSLNPSQSRSLFAWSCLHRRDPDFDQREREVGAAVRCASSQLNPLPVRQSVSRAAPRACCCGTGVQAELVNNCMHLWELSREAGFVFWVDFWGSADTAAPLRVVLKTNFGLGGSRMGRPFLILVSSYFGDLFFGGYNFLTFPSKLKLQNSDCCGEVNDNSLTFKRS